MEVRREKGSGGGKDKRDRAASLLLHPSRHRRSSWMVFWIMNLSTTASEIECTGQDVEFLNSVARFWLELV